MKEVYGVFVGGNNAAQPPKDTAMHAHTSPRHVRAYITCNFVAHNDRRETKYFVDHDGTVYSTGETDYSVTFNRKGVDAWHKVDALPESASFIGNYLRPTV